MVISNLYKFMKTSNNLILRKLFSLRVFIVLFTIIYSCSSDQESTLTSSLAQPSDTESSSPTKYTLTITALEGGTVSTKGALMTRVPK